MIGNICDSQSQTILSYLVTYSYGCSSFFLSIHTISSSFTLIKFLEIHFQYLKCFSYLLAGAFILEEDVIGWEWLGNIALDYLVFFMLHFHQAADNSGLI